MTDSFLSVQFSDIANTHAQGHSEHESFAKFQVKFHPLALTCRSGLVHPLFAVGPGVFCRLGQLQKVLFMRMPLPAPGICIMPLNNACAAHLTHWLLDAHHLQWQEINVAPGDRCNGQHAETQAA